MRKPSLVNRATKNLQRKWNNILPERVHKAVTTAVKQVTRTVVFGAGFTTPKPLSGKTFEVVETKAWERVRFYRSTAAAEGALTGAGGFIWGLADFPLWLTLKMKMLFELSAIYGFNPKDYKERLFILQVFQLAFSSQERKNKLYPMISDWDTLSDSLPENIHDFDWRTFQLEYRDQIDLAKMLQLIPGVGAAVGATVNYRLTTKLGRTAMNAFRLRSIDI